MRVVPLVFLYMLLSGCNSGKQDALDYYEEIYRSSAAIRLSEDRWLDEYEKYVDSFRIDSSFRDRNMSRVQSLGDTNKLIIEELNTAIDAVNALPDFGSEADIKTATLDLLHRQYGFHLVNVPEALNSFDYYNSVQFTKAKLDGLAYQTELLETEIDRWKETRGSTGMNLKSALAM